MLLAGVALAAGLSVPADAAGAFEGWRFKVTTICVNDHGWTRWPFPAAVAGWDKAVDVKVVRSSTCAGFPASQVVYLRVYNDPKDIACAKTGSDGYNWEYVYYADGSRKAVWTPKSMKIWMNMAPSLFSRCHATAGQRAHVTAHELGHALGLAHPPAGSPASVLGSWSVQAPTAWDIGNVNKLY